MSAGCTELQSDSDWAGAQGVELVGHPKSFSAQCGAVLFVLERETHCHERGLGSHCMSAANGKTCVIFNSMSNLLLSLLIIPFGRRT